MIPATGFTHAWSPLERDIRIRTSSKRWYHKNGLLEQRPHIPTRATIDVRKHFIALFLTDGTSPLLWNYISTIVGILSAFCNISRGKPGPWDFFPTFLLKTSFRVRNRGSLKKH